MKKTACFLFLIFLFSINSKGHSSLGDVYRKLALYSLDKGETLKEVTDQIYAEDNLPLEIKQRLQSLKRRFFVFSYPSDGLQVKSMISFVDLPGKKSLIFFLRGGTKIKDLPAFILSEKGKEIKELSYRKEILLAAHSNATIVICAYRGGVSPGTDEIGGEDVNDVKNLNDYLPTLFRALKIEINPKKRFMLGVSRGGMEMFLALGRFPELSESFDKYVSWSGVLNMALGPLDNNKWKVEMEKKLGPSGFKEWLDERNATLAISKMKNKKAPILIIQGTEDSRVSLEEGLSMVQTLRKEGFSNVSYWEAGGGNHVLSNRLVYVPLILTWLDFDE